MLKNYFTIAFRNLLRNKSYTFINVAGLTLGITTCIIIFLIIKREVSFDKAFSNSKNIYRIVRETTDASGIEKNNDNTIPFGRSIKE
jgi:putative ABC transport system permease protein